MTDRIASMALGHAARTAGSSGWIGAVSALVVLLVFIFGLPWFWLWASRRWNPGSDDSEDDNGGGGQRRRPTPPTRPPDSDPLWWPEFERDFAAYVERQLTYV